MTQRPSFKEEYPTGACGVQMSLRPCFPSFGYIPRGGIVFWEPDCFPHFPFYISTNRHRSPSRPAHTCLFTVAIFMMVRSVIFKVLKNQKKWTQKPSSSSFLSLFLSIFTASTAANINYQCGATMSASQQRNPQTYIYFRPTLCRHWSPILLMRKLMLKSVSAGSRTGWV